MEEKEQHLPKSGEIVGELGKISLEVEWRIPDFFSFPKKLDAYFQSSKFRCSTGTWYLKIYPNGESDSKDHIGLYVVRGDSGPPLTMSYTMSLKAADGQKLNSFHGSMSVFDEMDVGWGSSTFISKSNLKEISELVPSNDLTVIVCLVHLDLLSIDRTEVLADDLKQLMLSGDRSDVTVRVQGEEFRFHRLILGSRSPVFDAMFKNQMREATTAIVNIDHCDVDVFLMLRDYLYTGGIEHLTPENVFGLYEVAVKYQLDELVEDCVACIQSLLSVDTFVDAIRLALRHDNKELLEHVTDFFCDNMKDIVDTEKWEEFLLEVPARANKLMREALVHYVKKN